MQYVRLIKPHNLKNKGGQEQDQPNPQINMNMTLNMNGIRQAKFTDEYQCKI